MMEAALARAHEENDRLRSTQTELMQELMEVREKLQGSQRECDEKQHMIELLRTELLDVNRKRSR